MGDDNKILYGRIEQLTTRDTPQPIGTTFGPTPQHERYHANKFREGAAARAFKASREWVKWREKNGPKNEPLEQADPQAVYAAGYCQGAEETADLISAFVKDLCLKHPSIRWVQAIKDLQELLNGVGR